MMRTRCLDEVRVVSLIEGRLTTEELAATEAHIDGCDICRALLAELARDDEAKETGGAVSPGEVIGRYVILTQVGAGGMGAVFAAWDPELDRKVALKVVAEAAAADEMAQQRLVDEAKALASVRHPNVIAIYDVGRAAGRVFIAMEYMDAGTLRAWLSAGERSWRAIVGKYIAAGRGLAAAHEAGLVHRDFKPDNVLFSASGRCVVTDFGLASAPPEGFATAPAAIPETTAWGTPAYMAPEALRREPITARADQFSFCVSLWESLFGEPPFAGETAEARMAAVRDGQRRDSSVQSTIPSSLRKHVNQGLSTDPSARFESMNALLTALQGVTAPPRRVGWVIAAGAVAATTSFVIARGERECDGGRSDWRPMWSDVARSELEAAFRASGAAEVDETWRRFAAGVDAYVDDWATAHREACAASEGTTSDRRVATASMLCLSRRREQAFALLEALSNPTADALQHSLTAVAALPPVKGCAETQRTDQAAEPTDAETQAELEGQLAGIDTIWRLSQPEIVRPRLTALEQRARAAGADSILAGVRVHQGKLLVDAAEHEEAHEALLEGGMLALTSGAPEIAAEAWISLMALDGAEQQRFELAEHWEELAKATLARLDGTTRWHAMLAAHQGLVRANAGDWPASKSAWQEAVRIGTEILGEGHPDVVAFRVRFGEALTLVREFDAAREQHDEALAQQLQLYGEMHRETARTLRAIGHTLVQQQKFGEALEVQRRCLEIQRVVLPPGHREIGYTLGNLGITLKNADKTAIDAALAYMEEGLGIITESQDAEHSRVLLLRHQIARTLKEKGRLEEARDRWLAILDGFGPKPADHAVLARVHLRLGITLRELGDAVGSAEQLRAAVAMGERLHGADHPEVLVALVELGDTLVGANASDLAPLRTAIEHPAGTLAPEYVQRAKDLLAQSQGAVERTAGPD